ncbi:MAG: phosphotransferase [Candidatus Limnocylindria bacterium]
MSGPAPGAGATLRLAVGPDLGPGENVAGDVSGAAWTYLLPRRQVRAILSLGHLPSATERTLLDIAEELIVTPDSGIAEGRSTEGDATIRELGPVQGARWPLADASVELIVATDRAWTRRLAEEPALATDLQRVVTPEGFIFVQLAGEPELASGDGHLPAGFARRDLLWLSTSSDEVRAAAPARDRCAIRFLVSHSRKRTGAWLPSRLRDLTRRLRGRRVPSALLQSTGAVRWRDGSQGLDAPPQYLIEAAASAGLDISRHGWALVEPGTYLTKKPLIFLFAPESPKPELVVKLAREARLNHRVENALRALQMLDGQPSTLRRAFPRAAFSGEHGGLAFLAETVIHGTPLQEHLARQASDAQLRGMVEWLIDLGLATADAGVATATEIAGGLDEMLQQFIAIYRPAERYRRFLAAQIERVSMATAPFPLVLQHGDAGTWNVLVDEDAQPHLIDWEASVPHGLPLWDLFYFFRSFAVRESKLRGSRDTLAAFIRQFLQAGPLLAPLSQSCARFCAESGLEPRLVEPLFYTCWMHRALKEASTLATSSLRHGHYVKLLLRCIDADQAPGLSHLFGGAMGRSVGSDRS